jgi:hypothetical protein
MSERRVPNYSGFQLPVVPMASPTVQHVQVGVMQCDDGNPLAGAFDFGMGLPYRHLYPCLTGCIVNVLLGRKTSEVGDIVLDELDEVWSAARRFGFDLRDRPGLT